MVSGAFGSSYDCSKTFQLIEMQLNDEIQAGTYGQWGALLAGGEVIYPTGYGTLVTAVRFSFVNFIYGSIVGLESLPFPKAIQCFPKPCMDYFVLVICIMWP